MASLQDLPGYKLRNHRHWRVNRIKHHDNNLDKLPSSIEGTSNCGQFQGEASSEWATCRGSGRRSR